MRMSKTVLRRLVGAAVLGLCAASLAVSLAPLGWPFELFAHFRWQLAAATLVLAPAALALRVPRMLAVLALAGALQLPPFAWPQSGLPRVGRDCRGPELRLASVNLWYRHRDSTRVLAWLEAHPADVVVLQEVTSAWAGALAVTARLYPHRALRVREDPYGIGVLSRWPLERVEYVDFAQDGLPSLIATLDVDGRRVQVIALHTPWPVLKRLQLARDRALQRAAERARDSSLPTVLAGDFNLTPYAPTFHRLERDSRMRDAFARRLWRPTWQAGFWPLALPIDHVLVPPGACVQEATIGEDVGSDHRPVVVAVRWP
ncbi:MAG: hypothetical protein K0R70_175 [Steroidobacteraceae bacterium]|nr:hypothetical protein [Steroidobacteraceae bacterium]